MNCRPIEPKQDSAYTTCDWVSVSLQKFTSCQNQNYLILSTTSHPKQLGCSRLDFRKASESGLRLTFKIGMHKMQSCQSSWSVKTHAEAKGSRNWLCPQNANLSEFWIHKNCLNEVECKTEHLASWGFSCAGLAKRLCTRLQKPFFTKRFAKKLPDGKNFSWRKNLRQDSGKEFCRKIRKEIGKSEGLRRAG